MDPEIETLEAIAYRAWPAAEVHPLDGWRLRHSHGLTRRGNSAWVQHCDGQLDTPARIDAVERFYAERDLPTVFQLGPAPQPPDLDAQLQARGYRVDAPVWVQTALASEVRARCVASPQRPAKVRTRLTDDWLSVAADESRFAAHRPGLVGFIERLEGRTGFALAELDGTPVAAALAVPEHPWVGVFAMVTAPAARRQGAAQALLSAIAGWAAGHACPQLYLLVEQDNHAACALYAGAGFRTRYGYHYRVRDDGTDPDTGC